MPKKTGGGRKPQDFDPETGKFEGKKETGEYRGEKETSSHIQNSSTDDFSSPDSKQFYETLKKAKQETDLADRWRVDLHDIESYKNDKLFVTNGGSCIAVEPDGNIISVCHNKGDAIRGRHLLEKSLAEGGDRLDAFGFGLFKFYTNNGFEPVSWTPFNEEYAPDEWVEAKQQGLPVEKEPVIFYKYTGTYNRSNNPYNYDYFINNVKPSKDYDTAKEQRDKEM